MERHYPDKAEAAQAAWGRNRNGRIACARAIRGLRPRHS